MKYLIIAVFCLAVLVQELSGVPVNNGAGYKNAKKQLVPGTVTSYGNTEYSQTQYPSNYGTGASYSDPCGYNTGYNTGYTGYDAMGIPCNTAGTQEDLFNRKVQLVGVKNLNIKNGKVNPPIEIIQG